MITNLLLGIFIGILIYVLRLDKRRKAYAVKRLLMGLMVILVISLPYWFFVTHASGNPVDVIAGQHATEEVRERLTKELGLDRPWYVQYADWLIKFPTGNWDNSYRYPDKSSDEAFNERAITSAPLGIASSMIVIILGVPIGIYLAWKQGTWLDTIFLVGAQAFVVIPSLIVIQFYILVFAIRFDLLPAGWQGTWDGIFTLSAVIPILTLALPGIWGMAHFVRSAALHATNHSSVLAAKSKGLSTPQILRKTVIPGVRAPLVIALTPVLFTFFEGSFFVEKIYGIPGLAVFLLDSLFGRDYPVILNVGFLGICLGVLSKIVEDLLIEGDRRVDTI